LKTGAAIGVDDFKYAQVIICLTLKSEN